MNKKYILLFVCLLMVWEVFSQEVLPKGLSPSERKNLIRYSVPNSRNVITTAPNNDNLRNPAEWEEMQGLSISWAAYPNFLSEIVRHTQEEGLVYIFCSDSNQVKNTLASKSIPLQNVRYIQKATNSVWIRDYGANNVYFDEVGDLAFVDWVYNRPRPQDDLSPEYLAQKLGIDIYGSTQAPNDLVNTGGNFMSDGLGNAFASNLVMEENESVNSFNSTPKSEEKVDSIMDKYMNIERYTKMQVLDYDAIHHIDMHMKLLDEETILVGEYPDGVADGPKIEQNIQYILDNYLSVFGTAYKIVRIPMPKGTSWGGYETYPDQGGTYCTYTNSLILNKKVLVPIYNKALDTVALNIYKKQMPGYQIIGINANAPIQASGAIHCTTHEIAANNPLWIVHQALRNQEISAESYLVKAKIKHRNGIQAAQVYYKLQSESDYTILNMNELDNNEWQASIPKQEEGSLVQYYISATAHSGKEMKRPLPAPEAYWQFKVNNTTEINTIKNTALNLKYYIKEGQLHLYYTSPERQTVELNLYNLQAQKIKLIAKTYSTLGLNQHSCNINGLPTGIYLIRMQYGHQIYSKKIIIKS